MARSIQQLNNLIANFWDGVQVMKLPVRPGQFPAVEVRGFRVDDLPRKRRRIADPNLFEWSAREWFEALQRVVNAAEKAHRA